MTGKGKELTGMMERRKVDDKYIVWVEEAEQEAKWKESKDGNGEHIIQKQEGIWGDVKEWRYMQTCKRCNLKEIGN